MLYKEHLSTRKSKHVRNANLYVEKSLCIGKMDGKKLTINNIKIQFLNRFISPLSFIRRVFFHSQTIFSVNIYFSFIQNKTKKGIRGTIQAYSCYFRKLNVFINYKKDRID